MKTIVATLILSLIGLSNCLTSTDYDAIRDSIISTFRSNRALQATCMRLSFHDCVSAKCDGCVNMENPSNSGLQSAIDALETIYADFSDKITRADLWALSGQVAAEFGMEGMPGNVNFVRGTRLRDFVSPFTFKTGRADCATAPYTTDNNVFPSPHMTRDEMMQYFADNFGFSSSQVAALMGAHTLGRCSAEFSGYRGPWLTTTKGTTTFSSDYYAHMINSSLTYTYRNAAGRRQTQENARPQYGCTDESGSSCGIMLNTDFEVFYDFGVDADDFQADCTFPDCTHSDTYDLSAQYAANNDAWLADFVQVYEEMVARGNDQLSLVE